MPTTETLPGRTVWLDQKEYLYFSGTSYLGIPHNNTFKHYLLEGMGRYGTNYSSSRISNIQLEIFNQAEEFLADFLARERCVTLSSGFLAGKMLMEFVKEKGKIIFSPNAHPALIIEESDFYHGDFDEWVEELPRVLRNIHEEIFIVCNSVDPLFAKPISFDWIKDLDRRKKISVIIDDSHGLGLIGEEGAGISKSIKDVKADIVIIGSIGKALGIPGGIIGGKQKLIEQLKISSVFGGSSPVIPAYLFAFLKSQEEYSKARLRLQENIRYFNNITSHLNLFRSLNGFPIFYTAENRLCDFLLSKGIVISSFPYPTPLDSKITRVVINALHEKEDLEKLAKCIEEFED